MIIIVLLIVAIPLMIIETAIWAFIAFALVIVFGIGALIIQFILWIEKKIVNKSFKEKGK